MSSLPVLTYKELVKKLKTAGFYFDRQAKGSHKIWYNDKTHLRTTLPNHPGTIKKGTLKAIIKQIGLNTEDFLRL